ncbi:MAG: hypothetical protein JWN48_5404 [Myxococcaceae bacterium]|nr:hypothetical protein [Myxococcaceae bacterium]
MLLVALAVGCVKPLPQVPASQPHGTVVLKIHHAANEALYSDSAELDRHRVSLRRLAHKEQSARLRPGWHALELRSEGTTYELVPKSVVRPYGTCVDPRCSIMIPTRELQNTLAESGSTLCQRLLSFELQPGDRKLALLVVGPGERCQECLLDDLHATSCPPPPAAPAPKAAQTP